MASLGSHRNVYNTCLRILRQRGYRLWVEGELDAEKPAAHVPDLPERQRRLDCGGRPRKGLRRLPGPARITRLRAHSYSRSQVRVML